MRALLQRVTNASVAVDNKIIGSIERGLLIFLGVQHQDSEAESKWLAEKIVNLRIFTDSEGKMNLSIKDLNLNVLIISQFTLYGNCMNGRRPDFIQAAKPEHATKLYNDFIKRMEHLLEKEVAKGEFGADMKVSLLNDGPVTFLIEK